MDNCITEQLKQAKKACRMMQRVDKETKEEALRLIAKALIDHQEMILEENQKDIALAKENKMSEAMIDRLLLNKERIEAMANDILKVIQLDDPIGTIVREIHRPNDLIIRQIRIPIGVIGIIYESRPNVTVDIASLCIKTNNVCVLKGGKEAIHSNRVLVQVIDQAIAGLLPQHCVTLLETTQRSDIDYVIKAHDYVDVVIPRGSAGLINYVVSHSSVPVIETGAGICHLYIDQDADLKMAIDIAVNAKIQRPSVCNAVETILVHENIAERFLPALKAAFHDQVEFYVDTIAAKYLPGKVATEQNYATEYDDYICNIKVVKDVEAAIEHIYQYSTKHSEAIVTNDQKLADYFMDSLDSACVYHNASTRFTDGGQFGFGAEVGISTQKLHARGPLGLQEITSTKYKIFGHGQIRE